MIKGIGGFAPSNVHVKVSAFESICAVLDSYSRGGDGGVSEIGIV
jgi:hypothetical protein